MRFSVGNVFLLGFVAHSNFNALRFEARMSVGLPKKNAAISAEHQQLGKLFAKAEFTAQLSVQQLPIFGLFEAGIADEDVLDLQLGKVGLDEFAPNSFLSDNGVHRGASIAGAIHVGWIRQSEDDFADAFLRQALD